MRAGYYDIRDRIVEPPRWFDSNGVPRYGEFSPEDVPNIYANEAALLQIECQSCGKFFDAAVEMSALDRGLRLVEQIKNRTVQYGDPPIHGCSGDTMMGVEIRVKQYWVRVGHDWVRNEVWEVPLT